MTIKHTNDSLDVVNFARRNAGWHTFRAVNKRTAKAIARAVDLGAIEINKFEQFRLKYGR